MANERSFPVCCYCGACAAFIPDFKKYSKEEVVWDKGWTLVYGINNWVHLLSVMHLLEFHHFKARGVDRWTKIKSTK